LKPINVLLVEDNPDDVEITRRALSLGRIANDLQVARDGQEALDFLLRQGQYGADTPRPDLILLDLNLPKVNGMEVLERIKIKDSLYSIPVIMLTVSNRDEDVAKSYKLGSSTYIQKPVEFDKFFHAIEVLGEYWIIIATLPPKEA
jgi:CheY-like chemotaxis protein